jgi:hypothetical protein
VVEPQYPDLPEPFAQGLREAVAYILQHFDVLGIIAAGSVVRGEGQPTSDLDIYVIQRTSERQMIQKWFAGVPAQLFVNPPAMIERYFQSEREEGNCSTAHMLTTGFVVVDRDPVIGQLRQKAREILSSPPLISDDYLTAQRYYIADQYENALDMKEADPAAAAMLLTQSVFRMLHFYFLRQRLYIPRDKDLLRRVSEHSAELGKLTREFFQTEQVERKLLLAGQIADLTIQVRGFFEWQTPPEAV